MADRLLLYGATGHTGSRIARRAQQLGLDPVLAGRAPGPLQALAATLGCAWRVAACDDPLALAQMLDGVAVVLNAAGPFEITGVPIAIACMRAGCDYLDTSGEGFAYRDIRMLGARAAAANVALVPGAGFCVVASEILLRRIVQNDMAVPRAVRIAFSGGPGASVGSMKSLYASLYEGVAVVRDRRPAYVPIGALERSFDFGAAGGRLACTAITVADTTTAMVDVPSAQQVDAYVEGNLLVRMLYEASGRATHVTKVQPWTWLAQKVMARWPATPDTGMPSGAAVVVEADDAWCQTAVRGLRTQSTYDFTAVVAVALAQAVLAGGAKPGFQTPVPLIAGDATFTTALDSVATPL
jgi:short subunit dehydrogenase-like uncharacterized protein